MNTVAKERLYLNADKTKLVSEHEGHFLFKAEGDEITEAEVKRYNIKAGSMAKAEDKPAATAPEAIEQRKDRTVKTSSIKKR